MRNLSKERKELSRKEFVELYQYGPTNYDKSKGVFVNPSTQLAFCAWLLREMSFPDNISDVNRGQIKRMEE